MLCSCHAVAQPAFDAIRQNRNLAASNYMVYPDTLEHPMTPPPEGKTPFYLSHYGRHGSRYLSNKKAYDIPYNILKQADSLNKLTDCGKMVFREVCLMRDGSAGRHGDLTELGNEQQRGIVRRMVERFPEVFRGNAVVQARSTTKTRCVLSMGAALQQLVVLNPQLQINMDASEHDMWYMNYQDSLLRATMMGGGAQDAYDAFTFKREHNERLMKELFNDSVYVRMHVDDQWLNYYLFKVASILQNTPLRSQFSLYDIFTDEEIYRIWQKENAWWYICYGPSLLNGGNEPYTQRHLLRRIIQDADSCIQLEKPGVQLRFGHETMVLPLVCLMDINGFGFQTKDLEEVEANGWWALKVFPMAANLQFVFYRESPGDHDVLVKVLLNEKEAQLPVRTDCAPYYHWADVRRFYLEKLDAYGE
ncbi:MAG: histidine-type phosphatase [Bacteroidaceae bacterium]|nr:histidine-type phosphatase [Bacteroidaceae bacterium]